jgi:hypothetical protein
MMTTFTFFLTAPSRRRKTDNPISARMAMLLARMIIFRRYGCNQKNCECRADTDFVLHILLYAYITGGIKLTRGMNLMYSFTIYSFLYQYSNERPGTAFYQKGVMVRLRVFKFNVYSRI